MWGATSGVGQVLESARTRLPFVDVAVSAGARAPLTAILSAAREPGAGPVLLVAATTREAEDLEQALACFLSPDVVATFPSWETLPHER
ncbi:MAG: hypothetical protein M3Y71_17665, partial [Actinomycetota bacterium]|nr:hypothetical protein [Actinomycetota bacterium]